MPDVLTTGVLAAAAGVAGVSTGWAMTVPVLRWKEMRPKTPRDVRLEAEGAHPVVVRAVRRHARCRFCRRDCTLRDVAPLRSWSGRCGSCGLPERRWAAAVQVGLGLAWAATVASYPGSWVAVPLLWLAAVLVAVSVVDARTWLIPRRLVWTGLWVGLALVVAVSVGIGRTDRIAWALGCAVGTGLLFGVLWLASPGNLGFGDVRLSLLLGLFLGWVGLPLVFWGILLGSMFGVVRGLVSTARGQGSRFAFGPSLAAGTLVALWLHGVLLGT